MIGIGFNVDNVQYSILKIQYEQNETKVIIQNEENGDRKANKYNGILSISEIINELMPKEKQH